MIICYWMLMEHFLKFLLYVFSSLLQLHIALVLSRTATNFDFLFCCVCSVHMCLWWLNDAAFAFILHAVFLILLESAIVGCFCFSLAGFNFLYELYPLEILYNSETSFLVLNYTESGWMGRVSHCSSSNSSSSNKWFHCKTTTCRAELKLFKM